MRGAVASHRVRPLTKAFPNWPFMMAGRSLLVAFWSPGPPMSPDVIPFCERERARGRATKARGVSKAVPRAARKGKGLGEKDVLSGWREAGRKTFGTTEDPLTSIDPRSRGCPRVVHRTSLSLVSLVLPLPRRGLRRRRRNTQQQRARTTEPSSALARPAKETLSCVSFRIRSPLCLRSHPRLRSSPETQGKSGALLRSDAPRFPVTEISFNAVLRFW